MSVAIFSQNFSELSAVSLGIFLQMLDDVPWEGVFCFYGGLSFFNFDLGFCLLCHLFESQFVSKLKFVRNIESFDKEKGTKIGHLESNFWRSHFITSLLIRIFGPLISEWLQWVSVECCEMLSSFCSYYLRASSMATLLVRTTTVSISFCILISKYDISQNHKLW